MEKNIIDLHPGLIVGFAVVIFIMLLLDLGIFNKKAHEVTSKEATVWSVIWISLSMVFSGVVYWIFNLDAGGHEVAIEKFTQFQAAYWIEKALSVDNLFVFILVFGFFKVPRHLHHKVLFWGIIGALIFRAIFIFAGVGIINQTYLSEFIKNDSNPFYFTWSFIALASIGLALKYLRDEKVFLILAILFGFFLLAGVNAKFFINVNQLSLPPINFVMTVFGLFLVYAGIKSWGSGDGDDDEDFSETAGAKLVKKFYKVSDNYDGDKFFTIQNGVRMATPLLIVVAVIEFTDVLFAVDSIPAIFAISKDPFILYTSNIFAILGLRSLYFLLANFIHMFSKLPYGLAIILSFIGVKMLILPWYHISSPISLGIVGSVLLISVLVSIMFPDKEEVELAE
jgi:tellurite resistance protein TerC